MKTDQPTAAPTLQPSDGEFRVRALQGVLADRERELLELKGPCSNTRCRLHYAHSGPCATTQEAAK